MLALAAVLALAPTAARAKIIFRVRDAGPISTGELVRSLKSARVVFFGERHSSAEDHVAQRTVIQALHEAGVPLAIGMEMFRRDAQPSLDRWIAGALDASAFRALYDEHWDPRLYGQYEDILLYAKQERIPLVGLNIGRDLVTQVSRNGFGSLTGGQRRDLGVDSCDVSERYADILRRVTGGKELGAGAFNNFCEAQIVWDAAMARTIAEYLRAEPERTLFVICGTFHAWRHGIPGRLADITDVPLKIVLPSGDESVLRYDILLEDADYIWWHE
jgi:uncharacterized iron-regulated protein